MKSKQVRYKISSPISLPQKFMTLDELNDRISKVIHDEKERLLKSIEDEIISIKPTFRFHKDKSNMLELAFDVERVMSKDEQRMEEKRKSLKLAAIEKTIRELEAEKESLA